MSENLLVVDDEEHIRSAISRLLTVNQYSFQTASNGQEAFDLARKQHFDLALTDLRMPGMNGVELLKALKSFDPEMAVIFLTGQQELESAVEAMKAGAFDYVLKPFDNDDLLYTIKNALAIQTLKKDNIQLTKNIIASNNYIKNIVSTIPDILITIDAQAKITMVNEAAVNLTGYSREELIGQNINILCPSQEKLFKKEKLNKLISKNGIWDYEIVFITKTRHKVPLSISCSVMHQVKGPAQETGLAAHDQSADQGPPREEVAGFICIAHDLRHMHKLINELNESKSEMAHFNKNLEKIIEERTEKLVSQEKQFRNLIEKDTDALLIVDKDDVVLYGNTAVATVFGYPVEDFIGQKFAYPITSNWQEIQILKKGGIACLAEMRVITIEWDEKEAYLVSVRDITEAKNAERLRIETEEIKRIDQLKSEFVSTVSHELRTPLVASGGIITNLLKGIAGKVDGKLREYLLRVSSNIERLDRLVVNLLEYSRIEKGDMKLQREEVDLCELAKESIDNMRQSFENKDINIAIDLMADHVMCQADKDQIIQVFLNLLSNAVKFTPEKGTIKVSIKEDGDAQKVRVSVSDTGIGISPEDQDKLFKRFSQIGRKDSAGAKGFGLGLAITKGIVEAHKGVIEMESKINEGSTFSFILPKNEDNAGVL